MTLQLDSASTLALTPGTASPVPGVGASTESLSHDPFRHEVRQHLRTALERATRPDYTAWLSHVESAAACTQPVRLHGNLATVDLRTGEILTVRHTSTLPDGVVYKACGNRRHTVCPACASTYQHDAYHLIRAGLAGGKTVPDTVRTHPAVFATLTAPSFGPVHTRDVRHCACRDKTHCTCRPAPCHARRDNPTCPHGTPLACWQRHPPGDEQLGRPLCPDCYDYAHHVVWNHHSGELWRRTKQHAERQLNQLARRRGLPRIRLAHGKAAEYQARGAVHFHILLRLDGYDPGMPDAILPPPHGITTDDIITAVTLAATTITYTTPAHPDQHDGWHITWGEQLEVRPITLSASGDALDDQAVAAYLAKYSTKGTEATGHTSRRLTTDTIDLYANPTGTHPERLIATAWRLGHPPEWRGLRRWAHMLGFGGHFLTKTRRYSITFGAIREERAAYRRAHALNDRHPGTEGHPGATRFQRQPDLDTKTEETTLVIGFLTYAGTGWHTTGDQLLANTAAAQARERTRAGREELAHQQACSSSTPLAA
ncbi:plasmid replication initiator protein [Nonomuraea sp. FMUSA5-5]|uniref:Plasmid replication initiator protein n=1 Tax=Nonomuraea composti TaxID=2720023 RepID=A0ABX1B4F1_9ACTN|nr:replication initiator [Nonomuraea sp. FMUSA5-5]NJP90048.1 plasmid replication initiator protein [Nonomuraea sp. FMUSA5-5]